MRLTRFLQALACVAAGALVAACGTIELPTKKVEYKSASKLPPLEIPPDLTRPTADDRFVVPDVNAKGSATFSQYAKDRAGQPQTGGGNDAVLPAQDGARIERAGTQRWLVVRGDPSQVWPLVKDFWQEGGFVVNIDSPETGVMETDWAERRLSVPQGGIRGLLSRTVGAVYSTSERDKFRTRLERGGEPGTTEIYLSHRGMEEVFISANQNETRWQPRPADGELEAEMLRRLMSRFGVQQERIKTAMAVTAATPQAGISRSADGNRLALNEQFDRAWRRVGLALDRVGFTVEDRDRSKGIYFVRYIDPQLDNVTAKPQGGFLSRLWPFGGSGSDPRAKAEQFRILVREVPAGAEVDVLNKDGVREQSQTSNRILTLLFDQLK